MFQYSKRYIFNTRGNIANKYIDDFSKIIRKPLSENKQNPKTKIYIHSTYYNIIYLSNTNLFTNNTWFIQLSNTSIFILNVHYFYTSFCQFYVIDIFRLHIYHMYINQLQNLIIYLFIKTSWYSLIENSNYILMAIDRFT